MRVSQHGRCVLVGMLLIFDHCGADCELCLTPEASSPLVTFQIDRIVVDNSANLHQFLRMYTDGGWLDKLNITVNGEAASFFQCVRAPFELYNELNVTFMHLPNSSKSGECIGSNSTSVRIADWWKSLEWEEDGEVDVQFSGPSNVREICVGMEGGYCEMTGNGASYQRCFANPSMKDGCDLTLLHDNQTILLTSNLSSASEGSWNATDDSLSIQGYDQVYIGSIKDELSLFVRDIRNQTMIDIFSGSDVSHKKVELIDTSDTTLTMFVEGNQPTTVSAVGDTKLTSYVPIIQEDHPRVTINARCAQQLVLHASNWYSLQWHKWDLRVGCPQDASKLCKIKDPKEFANIFLKQVFVGPKRGWGDESIIVRAGRRSFFLNAYAAFYEDETISGEQCLNLGKFEMQCKLIDRGGRSYYWNSLCGTFFESMMAPPVHIIISMIYLLCVGSLFVMVTHEPAILRSRNIKLIYRSMLHSIQFISCWMVWACYYSNYILLGWVALTALFLGVHLWIAADMRRIQWQILSEIQDGMVVEKTPKSCYNSDRVSYCLSYRIWWLVAMLVYLEYTIVDASESEMKIWGFFWIHLIYVSLSVVFCSFCMGLPDSGAILGLAAAGLVFITVGLRYLFIIVAFIITHHMWNFFLLWSMILHFGFGRSAMTPYCGLLYNLLIQMLVVIRLFGQIFDLVSDWIIVVYFLSDELYALAFTEASFVLSAIAVSSYYQWNHFPDWWAKLAVMTGLGRVIQIFDTRVDIDTRDFLNEMELHLESLPSLAFGMVLLLTTPRVQSGPVILSMSVTWITVTMRAISSVKKAPPLWKCLIFTTLVTDYFVRCVSPALMIAVIQGQNRDDTLAETFVFFVIYTLTVLLGYLYYFRRIYSSQQSGNPFYLRAVISTLSVRCALFAYLRMDHYKHDAVFATPVDLAVLTLPHCLISLILCSISTVYLWDVFPGLCVVTVLFTLTQMGCVTAMCILSTDKFVFVDADEPPSKGNTPAMHEAVTSMSDALSFAEENHDCSSVNSP